MQGQTHHDERARNGCREFPCVCVLSTTLHQAGPVLQPSACRPHRVLLKRNSLLLSPDAFRSNVSQSATSFPTLVGSTFPLRN
jgi:hypothetical protein